MGKEKMNGLCCGKPMEEPENNGWHKSCIKHFFGTDELPFIDIHPDSLKRRAFENVSKGLTVPGVQKKLSLHLSGTRHNPRLTLIDYPTGYILKPQVTDFECLPEAEHLVMCRADVTGIKTVPHALIRNGNQFAYLTKRIDRIIGKNTVKKIPREDFCQLDFRLTEDKYRGSYERCAKIIERYSCQCGFDRTELFRRLVFSFVIGNSDRHRKNFSLIEKDRERYAYCLSKAYDLLPVNVILPQDKEEFALSMNGKKTDIDRTDFFIFAKECNIPEKSAFKRISKVVSRKDSYRDRIRDSFLTEGFKSRFINLIEERRKVLN